MPTRDSATPTRRRLLTGLGAALGASAVAGCTSTGGDPDDDSGTSGGADETGDDSDGGGSDPGDSSGDSGGGSDPGDSGGDTGDEPDCGGESVHESYEETAVTISTPEGEQLGSVTAAIADETGTRRTGLSETDCLPTDRGMLFVYGESQPLTFWMKDMTIGIDIVHIDSEGVITSIQHAEAPAEDEDGTEERHQYPGTGQFVLEVNDNWTTEHDVEVGDVVTFDL